MIEQFYKDIVIPELLSGAEENNEFHGFREDYHILHCLLRIHQPKRVMEYGCNMGKGTSIICNAVPGADVVSFDLPTEEAHISLQHPISEGKGDSVGHKCQHPFTLIRGNSYTFDFTTLGKFDFAFVDSEHNREIPYIEANAAIEAGAKVIVFHDADMPPVYEAICQVEEENRNYDFYRVIDTRIAYAVRK